MGWGFGEGLGRGIGRAMGMDGAPPMCFVCVIALWALFVILACLAVIITGPWALSRYFNPMRQSGPHCQTILGERYYFRSRSACVPAGFQIFYIVLAGLQLLMSWGASKSREHNSFRNVRPLRLLSPSPLPSCACAVRDIVLLHVLVQCGHRHRVQLLFRKALRRLRTGALCRRCLHSSDALPGSGATLAAAHCLAQAFLCAHMSLSRRGNAAVSFETFARSRSQFFASFRSARWRNGFMFLCPLLSATLA